MTDPFAVTWHGDSAKVMGHTNGNAARDGIRVTFAPTGAGQAGCAMTTHTQGSVEFVTRRKPERVSVWVPLR